MRQQTPSTGLRWTRRQLVAGVGTTVLGGIAGCTGGGGNPEETTTATEPATTERSTATEDDGGGPRFDDTIEIRDTYAFEITAHHQDLEVTGRHHQDDHYHDIRMAGGQRVESYIVDDTAYVVTGGVCIVDPDTEADPTSDLAVQMTRPGTFEAHVEGNASVRSTGTTTIDGEEVYTYEISTNDVDATYYVSTETGFLRRYEHESSAGEVVVEFHSWGDVDPIEPPDTTCA